MLDCLVEDSSRMSNDWHYDLAVFKALIRERESINDAKFISWLSKKWKTHTERVQESTALTNYFEYSQFIPEPKVRRAKQYGPSDCINL